MDTNIEKFINPDLISAVRDSALHIYTEGSDVKNMRKYFKMYPPLMTVIDVK